MGSLTSKELPSIRLTTRAGTPARIGLTLATPNNASTSSFTVNTEASCPGR